MSIVVAGVWAASLGALIVLWRKRPHTVLDVWLMVVMCAWLFDIALSAVLNAGRFDLGFYAGRLYGLAAGSLVLMVMLIEHGMLYRRLVGEHRRAQQKTAELMAAYKELDTFSYSVSHDLRAPLRAMDGYSQMLEEDFGARLDEEGRRLLGVIRSSSLHMGQLIDDLLAFSKLGRQEPAKHSVDMAALAHEVVEEVARGVSADIEVQALPPAQADRSLLRQVWTNLVGNALKYSGKRADPRIEIGGREGAQENVYWVRDNGAGFDMRYVDKLFGVFQRLHRAEDFPGTGVGLAIVQRVVARHGGRVWAEGQPGQGACFHFSLPKAG
jgi:light-regulated signal transduction histidine kinase (bacteriophytochrome)